MATSTTGYKTSGVRIEEPVQEEEEPIIVLEEEKDQEQLLEERRKKREAIMAKFKAQRRQEQPIKPESGPTSDVVGTGGESVNSVGTRTGGITTSGRSPI